MTFTTSDDHRTYCKKRGLLQEGKKNIPKSVMMNIINYQIVKYLFNLT